MHFNSRFHKEVKKTSKKIELSKIFNLDKKKERILPLGSCFLDELAYHLKKQKFNLCTYKKFHKIRDLGRNSKEKGYQFFFGNFFNPLNLLDNLERIILKKWKFKKTDYVYSEKYNHYLNLYIKSRFRTKKLNELEKHIKKMDNLLIKEIKKSTLIILSFDGTETWIDKNTNKAWNTFYGNYFNQKCYNDQAKLKVLKYNELKFIINRVIKLLNQLGEKKKFILINSPHQLIATYQNKDNQIADSYAKSTYISVFTDIQTKTTSYFPIYEILKNFDEDQVYEENYLYINSITKKKIIIPHFEKLYF